MVPTGSNLLRRCRRLVTGPADEQPPASTALRGGMLGAARRLWEGAVDLLLPGICAACSSADAAAGGLCDECNKKLLSMVSLPYCRLCGATVPSAGEADGPCRGCPTTLPRFEQIIRLGPYADPLRPIIRQLKYRRQAALVGRLARLLGVALAATVAAQRLDLVMPVPMHWRRRLGRGCDHSRVLAAMLARQLGLPLGHELKRVRNTPPQTHLPRTQRLANVRGAFAAARGVAGASVLLVDDVTTTGATADEAARTLLRAGAVRVVLAVLAKAEPPTAYQHSRE